MSQKRTYRGSKKTRYPGITQEGKKYRVRLFVDGTQYGLGRYDTLADARAVLDQARTQKALGTFVPPSERRRQIRELQEKEKAGRVTVAQWSETWLEALASDPDHPRSPGTITAYRSTLNAHVLPLIGDLSLAKVTEGNIRAVVDKAREAGPHAARNTVTLLRSMFNAAVSIKAGGLEASPVNVKAPRRSTRRAGALDTDRTATPAEVRQFAAAMPEPLRLAVLLGAWCALRQGEVLGLQRRDLLNLETPDAALVNIERQWNPKATPPGYTVPKADSVRRVHIPGSLVPLIVEHLAQRVAPEPTAPLFPSTQVPTQPVSQSNFDRVWREARDTVRPGFRFHDLRHTGLTEFARTGATLKEIMERGGHTDVNIAMRYQDAAAERDRALTAKMDAAIGGDEA